MKKILIIAAALVATVTTSCNKRLTADLPKAIDIVCEGELPLEVGTKTTEVASLPSALYWSATTGSTTSQTSKYGSTSGSVSSGKISTGKYQTATATTYNWYVSNMALTNNSGGTTISADGTTTDVIAGMTTSNSTEPAVTLSHIFARTGSLTASLSSSTSSKGYSLSNVSWKIVGKSTVNSKTVGQKGTYNISKGAFTDVSSSLSSSTAITSSSDFYLMPGTYTITCSFRLTLGDFVKDYSKSGDVTLVAGKKNSITATIDIDEAKPITLSVTLSGWGSQSHSLTFN